MESPDDSRVGSSHAHAARHLLCLNLTLRRRLHGVVSLHFDELETHESQRNTRPLSVPVLVESRSRYIVWPSPSRSDHGAR